MQINMKPNPVIHFQVRIMKFLLCNFTCQNQDARFYINTRSVASDFRFLMNYYEGYLCAHTNLNLVVQA